jgi:large subunit ribosomal protein L2
LRVGKVLFNLRWCREKYIKFYYKGFMSYLRYIPVFSVFCNVTNFSNSRITYAKAGGTFCMLNRNKKTKSKLISIVLPSKQKILLNRMTKLYMGKNTNYHINRLIEGKWGFSFHTNKKISVRGVAMNPVDHPNGGRAKSVQPEKSPWNWIAKKKK